MIRQFCVIPNPVKTVWKTCRQRLLLALLVTGCHWPACGQTNFSWAAASGGAWGTAANWSPAGPAAGTNNTAQFNQPLAVDATVTLDGNRAIGNLFFGTPSPGTANWILAAGTPSTSTLTLTNNSGAAQINVTNLTATVNAGLAGGQGFSKSGTGKLVFSVANTISGNIAVNSGALALNHLNGIASANALTIANGVVVQPNLGGTYASVPTTINGSSTAWSSFGGALDFHSGGNTTVTWPGQINLNSTTATIGSYGVTYSVTLSGQLTGSGNLIIRPEGGNAASHSATFTLSNPTNNFIGDTTMQVGTAQASATLKLGVNNALPTASSLHLDRVGGSGVVYFDLAGFNQRLDALTADFGSNAVINSTAGAGTLVISNSADSTFIGNLGTSGKANFNFTKLSPAMLTLNGTNLFSGVTTLGDGTLALNGLVTASSGVVLSNGATLLLGLTASTTRTNFVVNGNVTLSGEINVADFGIVSNAAYPVIAYTGTLNTNGLTLAPNAPWAFTVDTSVPKLVRLITVQQLPLAQFTNGNFFISTTSTNLGGILRGTPALPLWYEVRDQTNRLWDFGSTLAVSPWSITARHLRPGTNSVTIFARDSGGEIQSNRVQLVFNLGPNPPVRPRPQPAEIWWGGTCHDNLYDGGGNITGTFSRMSQLQQTNGWDFVKRFADGFMLHGYVWVNQAARMTNWQQVGASISAQLAPFNGRYWLEDSWQPPTNNMNYGVSSAAGQSTDANNLLGIGLPIAEITQDFNPKWGDFSRWHPDWPTNNIRVLVTGNTNAATFPAYPYPSGLWRDFSRNFSAARPDIKFGWTWSPVWFHWQGGAALGTDSGIFSVTNNGTNYNFNWDFYDWMNDAIALGNQVSVPFTFASDCPWDYYGKNPGNPGGWSTAQQLANRGKIRNYESWLRNQNLRHTLICNSEQMNPADTNASDLAYETNSLNSFYLHQQEGGRAGRYLFESWYQGPYTVVPETKNGSYTHLVLSAIKYLKGFTDTNGGLQNLTLTLLATNGGTNTITLTNRGDVVCMPAIAAFETGSGSGTVNYFDARGSNITAAILSAEGWVFTNQLAPGQATTIRVVPSVLPLNRAITLEAFWNPQDPTGIVRDRLVLSPPNTPPTLNAISNRTMIAGQTLTLTNIATDTNVPAQTLTFSLLSPPAGATVNSSNGIFSWRPVIAQSPSTNSMAVKVADNGLPVLSATQNFTVFVLRPASPQFTQAAWSNGIFQLNVNGDVGPDYSLQFTTNLAPFPNWTALQTSNPPGLPFQFIDSGVTNSARFYRIQLGP